MGPGRQGVSAGCSESGENEERSEVEGVHAEVEEKEVVTASVTRDRMPLCHYYPADGVVVGAGAGAGAGGADGADGAGAGAGVGAGAGAGAGAVVAVAAGAAAAAAAAAVVGLAPPPAPAPLVPSPAPPAAPPVPPLAEVGGLRSGAVGSGIDAGRWEKYGNIPWFLSYFSRCSQTGPPWHFLQGFLRVYCTSNELVPPTSGRRFVLCGSRNFFPNLFAGRRA